MVTSLTKKYLQALLIFVVKNSQKLRSVCAGPAKAPGEEGRQRE